MYSDAFVDNSETLRNATMPSWRECMARRSNFTSKPQQLSKTSESENDLFMIDVGSFFETSQRKIFFFLSTTSSPTTSCRKNGSATRSPQSSEHRYFRMGQKGARPSQASREDREKNGKTNYTTSPQRASSRFLHQAGSQILSSGSRSISCVR